MDTRTGRIYTDEELKEHLDPIEDKEKRIAEAGKFIQMKKAPTRNQTYRRPHPKVGRNEPCPCGSGLKFKKCCLNSK